MLTCIILEEKGSCAGSFEDDTNAARGLSLMLAAWECQKRFYIVLIALFFISTLLYYYLDLITFSKIILI